MKCASFEEAAGRVLARLREYEGLKGTEVLSAYPFLDAPRPLAQPTVAVGLRGASAVQKAGEIELWLWLYVPERQDGDALTALFSSVCSALLGADDGVVEVRVSQNVEYSGELYAFLLPCSVQLTFEKDEEGEEAPLIAEIEIRGDAH